MATVLIDTSVLVDAERRGETLEKRIDEQDRAISVITVSELLHGVHRADSEPRRLARQAFVEQLLARLEPVPVSVPIARVHAEIWARLEADGQIIGAHDLWIAATALALGMALVTTNVRDFGRILGLTVIAL